MEFLATLSPEVYIKAGVTIGLIVLIIFSYKKDRATIKMISKHFEEEAKAKIQLAKALQRLTDKIENLLNK